MVKRQTKEDKALAVTTEGVFKALDKAVPKGATTIHVLEAAATLIGSTLSQMNATKQELHAVVMHIEEYALKSMQKNNLKQLQLC